MPKIDVETMLKDLMVEIEIETLKGGEKFVRSVNSQFKEKGRLSPDQESTLRKIYEEHFR